MAGRRGAPRRAAVRVPDSPGGTDKCGQARRTGYLSRRGDCRPRLGARRDHRRWAGDPTAREPAAPWTWSGRDARACRGPWWILQCRSATRWRLHCLRHAALPTGARMSSSRRLGADDQALLRGSFRVLLETTPDMTVVAEAATGLAAV